MPIIGLKQTVAPTARPLSLDDAKAHLRIVHDAQDDEINGLIDDATNYVEAYTLRQLITATWQLTLDRFPCGDYSRVSDDEDRRVIRLPRPPLLSVSSIVYVALDGTSTTLAADQYRVDLYSEPGRIEPAYGSYWPPTRYVSGAVTITYTAGYGESAAAVPTKLRRAMKLLIGHWNENRENAAIPEAVDRLLFLSKVAEVR